MKEKFLPIGTVVLLKNGTKKIMITGYLPVSKDENKTVYDYSACLFPEGIISVNQTAVFNHDQIVEVIQEGYSNQETEDFMGVLKDYLQKNNPNSQGANQAVTGEVETLDAPPKENSTPQPEEQAPAPVLDKLSPNSGDSATEVKPEQNELELPKESVEMPVSAAPAAPTPAAPSVNTPETVPETTPATPIVEETPIDPSAINPEGASPMGVDSIKPFSE